jgi:ribulose-phosphate 3-epimerase
MTEKYLIAPSIVSADFLKLKEAIDACESAGADWIHVDVMDGHFVPNITMGPFMVETFKRATGLPLDVHLMIEPPEPYLEAFAKAGAAHLIVHVEACPDLPRTLQSIRALGCLPGVAVSPATPITAIEPVMHLADLVLVMSVHPGFSNQAFMPETFQRVAQARKLLDVLNPSAYLEVDGGVAADNLPALRGAGANVFVSAHSVFTHPGGIQAGIRALREAAA